MIKFVTNVDCAKPLMYSINGRFDIIKAGEIHVGDNISVYKDSHVDIQMTVTRRTWNIFASPFVLEVELVPPPHFASIRDFEKFVMNIDNT